MKGTASTRKLIARAKFARNWSGRRAAPWNSSANRRNWHWRCWWWSPRLSAPCPAPRRRTDRSPPPNCRPSCNWSWLSSARTVAVCCRRLRMYPRQIPHSPKSQKQLSRRARHPHTVKVKGTEHNSIFGAEDGTRAPPRSCALSATKFLARRNAGAEGSSARTPKRLPPTSGSQEFRRSEYSRASPPIRVPFPSGGV